MEQDHALIHHVDSLCRSLATTADSLEPWDITLSDAHVTSHKLSPLQGVCVFGGGGYIYIFDNHMHGHSMYAGANLSSYPCTSIIRTCVCV